MRKVGIYYAYWCEEWDTDFFPFIKKVKDLGYDQLEINGGTVAIMTEGERKRLLDEAKAQGVTLSYGIGLTAEHDVSSKDDAVRQAGLDFMTQMIKAVGSMGGGTICGTVYSTWPRKLPKGENKQDYLDRSIESMKILSKIAEKEHVILLCEVINRFEQFLLNTCEEALAFVKKVDNPACKILLDTFHMNIEEDSFGDAIRNAGSYLGGLHLGECNRKPVGMGRMPWDEIKKALDDIGFTGALVQEPFILPGGQVGQDIAVWREVVKQPNLDLLAKNSAIYIREHLA
ncbi:sugar phosphate isomerase/epimerase family protein [uncultured Sphaerochaeta sp.]|uniref:D-psicose 3-epimerase n=1 Tax=uncultured Sphaerochaeta sp. TaxID=886478 RepID=UPI002A0A3802|nr:sugar phosphate isomerase/epimerase family protein [uncultured Sphaerochaeta sp.]